MVDNLINILENDEKILFHSNSNIDKTDKQMGRFLLLLIVLLIFWTIYISLGINESFKTFFMISFLIVISLLTVGMFYGCIYNCFLKYKKYKYEEEYFVSNKRIAICNKKYGIRVENISDIERMMITREKNNYGDVTFGFKSYSIIEQMQSTMCFKGVENPRKVVNIITQINKDVLVYDDSVKLNKISM